MPFSSCRWADTDDSFSWAVELFPCIPIFSKRKKRVFHSPIVLCWTKKATMLSSLGCLSTRKSPKQKAAGARRFPSAQWYQCPKLDSAQCVSLKKEAMTAEARSISENVWDWRNTEHETWESRYGTASWTSTDVGECLSAIWAFQPLLLLNYYLKRTFRATDLLDVSTKTKRGLSLREQSRMQFFPKISKGSEMSNVREMKTAQSH